MSETNIKHLTSCRICNQQFQNWQMDIPIVGQPVTERARAFVTTLAGHLHKKHPEKMQAILLGGQEFMGMLIMMLFSTSDPNLTASTERARQSVATVARKMVTDEEIEALIVEYVIVDCCDQSDVRTILRALRDRCCEIQPQPEQTPA